MMDSPYLYSAVVILIYMIIFYLIALGKKDYSIVDAAWGLGFVVVSRFTLAFLGNATFGHFIFNLAILLWGLRLAFYLYARNKKVGEDYRYAQMRKDWGKNHRVHAFFKVFLLQGSLMWTIALPIIATNANPSFQLSSIFQYIGVGLWVIGFLFEAVSDHQMSTFKNNIDNYGQVMQSGLWKYSRHPNYFGETLLWWGIFLMAFEATSNWVLLVSPILITFLLLKVSGVTLLERKLSKNPKYNDYKATTSAFVPWPPKKALK